MAKKAIYEQVTAAQWVQPVRRGYKMACCDCGLVHILNFRLIRKKQRSTIQFQAFLDKRATAAIRREERKRKARNG